jgi:hypothetical protein
MDWIMEPIQGFAAVDLVAADECNGGAKLNSCSCTGGLLTCSCSGGLVKTQLN